MSPGRSGATGRLRVAYVYREFASTGSIPSVYRRHAELLSRDEDVTAVCSTKAREPSSAPVRFLDVDPLVRGDGRMTYAVECASFAVRATLALRRARDRFDVIHVEGFAALEADLVSVHAVRRAEAEHYFTKVEPRATVRRVLGPYLRPQSGVVLAIERRLLGRAPHPVCTVPTQTIKDELCRIHGVPRELVEVIRYGRDVPRFRFDAEARARVRARHGVPDDRLVVLFVGDGFERKGLGRAIDGLARAAADAELWVIGAGATGPYAEAAARAGIADRVRFLGPVPNAALPAYYSASDVFLLPSQQDSWGHTVVEALAAGRMVVVSAFVGASELLCDGRAGIVLSGNGPAQEIARALDGPASDPAARAAMGERGSAVAQTLDYAALYPRFREVHHLAHEVRLSRLGLTRTSWAA